MGVVHVEPGPVGEHGVGQVRLDDGREGNEAGKSTRVEVRGLAFEVQLIRVRPVGRRR